MIDPKPGESFEYAGLPDSFDFPNHGIATVCNPRFTGPTEWRCADGARLRRYHASSWQAQHRGITTKRMVSAAGALAAFNALEMGID
jgi:hypothetical protein